MLKFYNKNNLEFTRKLRKISTPAERLLWSKIRNNQLIGLKFRRQYSANRYILDFYCAEINLGIEIDGSSHDENKYDYDIKRQETLERIGVKIIRFTEFEVNTRINEVLKTILNNINK